MHEFFAQFLRLNERANQLYIEAIVAANLSSERVPKIFCHMLNAQRIWNKRIAGDSTSTNVWDISPIEEWAEINRRNSELSLSFVQPESLTRTIDYKDLRGMSHRRTLAEILTHIVNHSTYHRGQLALLFGNEQKEPPSTDFIRLCADLMP